VSNDDHRIRFGTGTTVRDFWAYAEWLSVAEACGYELLTTGDALWRVHNVARAFPDLTMVVLDTFSSHEQASHAMTLAELAPNLVFDTSLAYTIQPALRLIERFGHHRVIFGTDLYSHPLGYKRSTVIDQLLDADLPKDVLQDVLAGTAERVLGLAPIDSAAL
jgi:predicted TIM-barrel fold metal-dependent hydrolase